MFKSISAWWNRDKIVREAAMKQLEQYSAELATERKAREHLEIQHATLVKEAVSLESKLNEVTEEVGVFRTKAAEDAARRAGVDPWVEIKSERIDPIKGIQIELDWNPAFIQYLKDNGITARDEETAVQKWIAMLYQNLMERLEKVAIDNSDKPRVNDYQ